MCSKISPGRPTQHCPSVIFRPKNWPSSPTSGGRKDILAANPLAWQSFRILEDVAGVIDNAEPADEDLNYDLPEVEAGLLAHAARLLETVVDHNRARGCRLEWGWLENQPALRLLAAHIDRVDDDQERLRLLEWLVNTLNPNDNQGLRETLAQELIMSGRAADALALCDRYPDDGLGAMIYARVLALQQTGRPAPHAGTGFRYGTGRWPRRSLALPDGLASPVAGTRCAGLAEKGGEGRQIARAPLCRPSRHARALPQVLPSAIVIHI